MFEGNCNSDFPPDKKKEDKEIMAREDYDPRSWHNAYGGNLDSDVHITHPKFVPKEGLSLNEEHKNEMKRRIAELQGLMKRSDSEGEYNFHKQEHDDLNRQLYRIYKEN
jgi:hypothetical protein